MSSDYRVKGLTNEAIRSLAKRSLEFYRASNRYPVNVLSLIQTGTVCTVRGDKKLVFRVVPDVELGDNDAVTTYAPGVVEITCKMSVRDRAALGVGRDRMTLAHELGHAVLHEGPAKARATGAVGRTKINWIAPFESAEHQAKVFAAAFLIVDEFAEQASSAEEVSVLFGVSIEAAEIYFARLIERQDRPKSVARVKQLAAEFARSISGGVKKTRYLATACQTCGQSTLIPIGGKYLCDTCERIGDLPDGDSAEE
jgi:hypothetical protein